MVKRGLQLLLVITLCAGLAANKAFAVDRCSKATEFEPALCPLKLPPVRKLIITENAATSSLETDSQEPCSSFTLNTSQLHRYLSKAKRVNEQDALHNLDWSACYASGKLIFADGSSAHWSVNRYRSGTLLMPDGKKISMYCPSCTFPPFQR
jgi:hypothetical protein